MVGDAGFMERVEQPDRYRSSSLSLPFL